LEKKNDEFSGIAKIGYDDVLKKKQYIIRMGRNIN
jgi:hypothetical protein